MKTTYRVLCLALILIMVTSVVPAIVSAQDVAREDTVIVDIDRAAIPNPGNFNPFIPNDSRNTGFHQLLSEPLFILNYETGEIMPWLAESMEFNEALDVWTLHLRDGAHWSDGEAFTAADVVFTIEMLAEEENVTLNNAGDVQQWIESVEAVDDYTVVFNLTDSNPRFQLDFFSVRIWGGINIVPEHIWAGEDPFTFTYAEPIGTGPYTLTSATETEVVWDRDDNWWGAETGVFELPVPLRVIFIITGIEQTKVTLAASGELDSVMDITLGAFEALRAENPNIIAWNDGMPWVWLDPCPRQLSLQHTVPPWDNPRMRQMLNLAIDREEVVEIAYEGVTIPSRSMFVEYGGMFPYIDAMEEAGLTVSPTADLEAAEAILLEEGYERNADGFWEKDGEVLSLDIQASETFIEKRRIAADLVEQFQRFGIDAYASIIAVGTWDDNKAFGNFEGTLDWDSCASVNEPWASMNRYNSRWLVPVGERSPGNNNYVRWSGAGNDAYTELVNQIGVLPLGDPQIVDLVVEAMTIWYDEMPFIPLTQATKLVPFDTTYWVGWPTAENNYNHPATWWQSFHQVLQHLEHAGM